MLILIPRILTTTIAEVNSIGLLHLLNHQPDRGWALRRLSTSSLGRRLLVGMASVQKPLLRLDAHACGGAVEHDGLEQDLGLFPECAKPVEKPPWGFGNRSEYQIYVVCRAACEIAEFRGLQCS